MTIELLKTNIRKDIMNSVRRASIMQSKQKSSPLKKRKKSGYPPESSVKKLVLRENSITSDFSPVVPMVSKFDDDSDSGIKDNKNTA